MSKFIHTLTHVRTPRDETTPDDYGQPADGTPVETEVRGLVQPRAAREMEDARSAGAMVANHVIFLPVMDVSNGDAFEYGGDRYNVIGVRPFLFGGLAHLEVDAERIVGTTVGEEGS